MSGIYDRISDGGLDGEGEGRVNINLMFNGIIGIAANMAPYDGALGAAKLTYRDQLNVELQTNNPSDALRPEDEADLSAIIDQLDGQPNTTAKLVYAHKLQASMGLAELGQNTEAQFRANLGI